MPDTNAGSSSSKLYHVLPIIRFSGSSSSLVMLDLMSDDHVTRYAAIFWRNNMKNYNLLLANWKVLKIFAIFKVFRVEKFIGDVRFAIRQPRDRLRCHFLVRKYEFLINGGISGHVVIRHKI